MSDVLPPIHRELLECGDLPSGGFRLPSGFVVFGDDANAARYNLEHNIPVPLGGTNDPRSIKKISDFRSQEQYLTALREVRRYDDAGDFRTRTPWKLWQLCKSFVSEAQNIPDAERRLEHRCALVNHFRPRFVTHKFEKDNAAKREATLLDTSMESPTPYTLGRIPVNNLTGNRPTRGLPKRSLKKSTKPPSRTAPLEQWLTYVSASPENIPYGVKSDNAGRISVRSLRGRLTIAGRFPKVPNTSQMLARTKFLILASELFATPGLYSTTLQQSGVSVASRLQVNPFAGDLDTCTINDLARFFASQGVTVLAAEDAAMYAYDWLSTASTTDTLLSIALQTAKNRTVTAIRNGIFPAGLDDNYSSPAGLVTQASFSVPGTSFIPVPPTSTTDGLPYGNPSGSTAGASSSLGTNVPATPGAGSSSSSAVQPPTRTFVSGVDTPQSPSNDDDVLDYGPMSE